MSGTLAHNLEEKRRTKDIFIDEDFSFNSLLLSPLISQGLKDAGFYKPSPIQLKAIPLGKCGLDLIVQAKSGTGKTVVFTVIALDMIQIDWNALQVLVFAPTREIAVQIEDVFKTIGKHIPGLRVGSFIGGLPIENDIRKIKKCHIAVGAPGRLKHLVDKGYLKTQSIRLVILDEADKLMELAFQNDINFIYGKLSENKQTLTLSATYTEELRTFLSNYMRSPTFVTPESKNPILLGIKQFVTVVKEHINVTRQILIKTEELVRLLTKISYTQCLVFFNSQSRAEGISNTLNRDGWNTVYISAAQSQVKRLKTIESLKKFECRILLSTDLTARGIDAANVDLIINYDVPNDAAIYLHRMGRAGRYGSHGLCITIAGDNAELKRLQAILGEVGGTELSIAKLPDVIESVKSVWENDYNSFEKIHGVIDEKNVNKGGGNDKDLVNSVVNAKASWKESGVENAGGETMSQDLKKLTFDESHMHKKEATKAEEMLISNGGTIEKFAGIDTESLLKQIAAGKDVSSMINEAKKNTEEEIEASNNADEEITRFDELYPWVPVEDYSVFSTNENKENLLEDIRNEQENFNSKQRRKNKRELARNKETKKSPKSDDGAVVDDKVVAMKNLASFNVCRLLEENVPEQEITNITSSLVDYLNYVKDEKDAEVMNIYKSLGDIDSVDILKQMAHFSQQWNNETKIMDPAEDIFRLGYNYSVEDGVSWITALGDRYKPIEEKQENKSESDEDMEEDTEEYDKEEEMEEQNEYVDYNEISDQAENLPLQPPVYPTNLAHCHSGDFDHVTGDAYDWRFGHYGLRLLDNVNTFQDVPSFDRYFSDWQSQVKHCRDFVQQNIYLQEMNHYMLQRGNSNYDNRDGDQTMLHRNMNRQDSSQSSANYHNNSYKY